MKTIKFLSAILVLGILFSSCEKNEYDVTPSGNVTTKSIPISGINFVDVSSLFNVYVSFSDTEESAYIEADDNLHSLIEIDNDNGRLKVELEDTNIIGEPVLNLYVKTNSLDKIKGEGLVTIMLENQLENVDFEIELKGASKLSGSINTDFLTAQIEGASKLDLTGFSGNSSIDATGASEMTGFNFSTNNLDAKLEGGCKVSLTVQQSLKVDARGASKVYYKGNGIVENQNLKNASEIIKAD
ncbi:GIN domain-containing protein [Maribellus sediminis]|uniref:GIN domain-containing protein n=1 Tax=Maribellus sediminis TaxID=2696285 RepID=UPI0014313759|nr:DUF2807 domain-containing protein [Maribellus sediminis]